MRLPFLLAIGIPALLGCKRESDDKAKAASVAVAQNVARACKDVDPGRMPDTSAPAPREGYTTVAERDSMLRLIERGEEKWRAARPRSYSMTVVARCFCRDRGQPVILQVVADSVVASRDTTGQQSWPDDWRTGLHVAGLFKEARQFACDSTRTTRVTFDPKLGFPSLVTTKSRLEMSDTDREYGVLAFERER
jgi:hypothetical protein